VKCPHHSLERMAALTCLLVCFAATVAAQTSPEERTFPEKKTEVDLALKAIQTSVAGRLPALDGFVQASDHPLERYDRGYYQATVQISATPSGGSRVHVSVKVTAWYNDPANDHSGYQLLTSNGRLEADLLDRLAEQLAKAIPEAQKSAPFPAEKAATPHPAEPKISAPGPKSSESGGTFSSSMTQSLAAQQLAAARPPEKTNGPDAADHALRVEADSLEQVLKNQGHPKNLVAVKKSGTPVVATASLTAKPLFLASMHDEFEMLDFNADWVHVRISGLSRGWIWRNSLEMPEGIPDAGPAASAQAPAADLFHVVREEAAPFPGDWEPLRGKNVKIVSVQKVGDDAKEGGLKERLAYTKYLFDANYKEIAAKPDQAGLVVIFDSSDGGMIAATLATLQQWKAGTLTDAALWHKCFFDPPEAFDSTGTSASQ